MKSSYELAMERLGKQSPAIKLTDGQKKRIAGLEAECKAKIADREIFVKGELAKAVEVQTRAVELDAKEPMLRWRLAQLLVENGDKSAARKHLEVLASMGTRFAGQAEVSALLKAL